MDSQYTQQLRYKLQKRFRRVSGADHVTYHAALVQFWSFLNQHPVYLGILDVLVSRVPDSKDKAETIIQGRQQYFGATDLEAAAVAYWIVKHCVDNQDGRSEINIAHKYTRATKAQELLPVITDIFAEPLYEYIDEQLNDSGVILALLRKYKHRTEWFRRETLFDAYRQETRRGEKKLVHDLYEYLHEQGIEFYIEPWSVSGEIDLLSSQSGDERLAADGKIFAPDESKGRGYVASGFKQLYQYLVDHNETVGYLVIYNVTDRNIRFSVSLTQQLFPGVVHNNKTIYLIAIDLFPHEKSASKRGRLDDLYEITDQDLLGEQDSSTNAP